MRCSPVGSLGAKLAIVGEAPGGEEEALGAPFIGASGQEFLRMLMDAGLLPPARVDSALFAMKLWQGSGFYITNVFMDRPDRNNIELFFTSKKEGAPGFSPLRAGKYIKPEKAGEIQRLREELLSIKPNLVIALGGTASWALVGNSKITNIRGAITESTLIPGQKVLPTFHPAAVLRQWDHRPTVLADLMKAGREMAFPELRPSVERELWIEPTLEEIQEFSRRYIEPSNGILSIDIETRKHSQISCIGFAPDPLRALCIPFIDERKEDWNYWRPEQEVWCWNFVKRLCLTERPKVLQNGAYDVQYLWRKMGITVRNWRHDTMLLHHAAQPELPKGLGFLGSVYCQEAAWKSIRKESEEEKPND